MATHLRQRGQPLCGDATGPWARSAISAKPGAQLARTARTAVRMAMVKASEATVVKLSVAKTATTKTAATGRLWQKGPQL